ncbi:tape measure protein [Rhodocyclus tenuis]|uniref:Tape measure domain-containing protein n=1 Tax=Rhodocyclus tenuis TaxID=1066 RepID=A0A840G4C4_RHOTE|nr:tape measure protein [Rhodocyclus tenuis]MBB4247243.1 tape measure domain-containing protein [Rhodocyclus tenuis]
MNRTLQYLLRFTGDTGAARAQIEQLDKSVEALGRELKQVKQEGSGGLGLGALSKEAQAYLNQLKQQADAIGKTRSELAAQKAAMLGVADAAAPYIAKLREAEDATRRTGGVISSFLTGLGSALLAGLGAQSIVSITRALIDAQLASDKLASQLKYVAGSSAGAKTELGYLRDVTQRLGLDFSTSADAYAKFAAATKEAGISSATTRAVFEGIAKASMTMGLSAAETQGALLALSQMASKSVVSAEELRGQLGERLPGAFALASKAMGVTEAQLSKLLDTGQLMASDFLPKFGAALNAEFSTPVRSLQAELNRLSSAMDLWKRQMADADGGLFKPLTNGLNESTAAMKVLGQDAGVVHRLLVAIGAFQAGAFGVGKFDTTRLQEQAMAKLQSLKAEISALEEKQSNDGSLGLIDSARLKSYRVELARTREEINQLAVAQGKETGFKAPDLAGDLAREKAQAKAALTAFTDQYKDSTAKAAEEVAKYKAAILRAGTDVDPQVIAAIQAKYNKGDGAAASAQFAQVKAQAEAEMKLMQQQLAAAGDAYQRAYDQRLIGVRDFYATQAALQDQALAAQEKAAQQELSRARQNQASAAGVAEVSKRTAEVTRLEGELAVITAKRGQVQADANAKTALGLKTLSEQLDALRLKLAEAMGEATPEQIGAAVAARYKDILQQAKINAADLPGGVDLVEKMIDVETAKERLAQIQAAWTRTTSALNAEEQRINILRENGLVGEIDARSQILQLQRDAATALQGQLPMLDELAAKYPQLATEIAKMKNEWVNLSTVTDAWTATFNSSAKSALATFFEDATNRSKGFGQAALSALNSIRSAMVRLAAERLAEEIFKVSSSSSGLGLFGSLLGALGFGGSTASSSSASSVPGYGGSGLGNGITLRHTGGLIGLGGGLRRSGLSFSAAAIAAAPRFHQGGEIGANERLLVGKVGEEVVTEDDPRHSKNGGGSKPEIHIHEAAGARVSQVQSSSDGSRFDVFLEQVDGFLARNLVKGNGAFTEALESVGAISRGRSIRGG